MPDLNLGPDGLALEGFDLVSYFKGEPLKGNSEWRTSHGGFELLFASEANLREFLGDPDKYQLKYGGWCAVAMSEGTYFPANPKTFIVDGPELLVFYNGTEGNTKPQWEEDPTNRKTNAEKHWGQGDVSYPES